MSYKLKRRNSGSSTLSGNNPSNFNGDQNMLESQIFENKDFYLSAFLMASGIDLISHRRKGSITVFGFQKNKQLKQLVDQYYNYSGEVIPMRYGSSIRNLKNILHSVHDEVSESHKDLNNEFTNKQRGTEAV